LDEGELEGSAEQRTRKRTLALRAVGRRYHIRERKKVVELDVKS